MATWTVLTRALAGDTGTAAAERVVFVREKFSWAALFLAPFVLLRYRLWLPFAAYVVVSVLAGIGYDREVLPDAAIDVVMIGFHLLVALELPALRVRKLAARGFAEEGVVIAEDRVEAEQRFFAEWAAARPAAQRPAVRPQAAAMPGTTAMTPSVIGSFPGAGTP